MVGRELPLSSIVAPADTPGAPQVRPREMWIDVVRGETVLLIIVFHSTGLLRYGRASAPKHAVTFNNLSEPYWMPTSASSRDCLPIPL